MAFERMPGVIGKVYAPDPGPDRHKKHGCKDCFACQMCGDDRCRVCGGAGAGGDGRRCDGRGRVNPRPSCATRRACAGRSFQSASDS